MPEPSSNAKSPASGLYATCGGWGCGWCRWGRGRTVVRHWWEICFLTALFHARWTMNEDAHEAALGLDFHKFIEISDRLSSRWSLWRSLRRSLFTANIWYMPTKQQQNKLHFKTKGPQGFNKMDDSARNFQQNLDSSLAIWDWHMGLGLRPSYGDSLLPWPGGIFI